MTVLLHSPTEPATLIGPLRRAAERVDIEVLSSSWVENNGVDFYWRNRGQTWGIQRKEIHDLLASLDDGRLAKEVAQMRADIGWPVLLIEGRVRFSGDHLDCTRWGRPVSKSQWFGMLWSLARQGLHIFHTADHLDTADFIVSGVRWTRADSHSTAIARPKPGARWGKMANRDFQLHLLQGLPGIGPKTAALILDTLGRCPMVLDVDVEELASVPGIGKATAIKLVREYGGGS